MLFRALPLLFALLALCAFTVEARPMKGRVLSRRLTVEERSLTNAERMKRGLPPRAPVIGRMLPGRELLFDPTPASKAKRGSPSPSPTPKSFSGRVHIKATNGSHVGFLNNTDSGFPNVDYVGTPSTDIVVKISPSGKGPFDLVATNAAWAGSPLLGGGTNDTLSSDSVVIVPLSNTTHTAAGAPPTSKGASAIWSFDSTTLELTPKWTNLNGSSLVPTIGWHKESNLLFFIGNDSLIDGIQNVAVDFFLEK
ncbi:hypothetical protein PsYK624_073300 [Phanerochaete sordida]|uniref:Uncharacterized protein n=1 Tax=Phanerochaete sordida TaxID=48140 RepID=A0A9P3LD54_9APHY|nr:hypothetical protein PsYK624_073300 [Phanerochaete sordida]